MNCRSISRCLFSSRLFNRRQSQSPPFSTATTPTEPGISGWMIDHPEEPRNISNNLGTVEIPRVELPEKLVDAISYADFKPGDEILALCTEAAPTGKLGETWHLFSK